MSEWRVMNTVLNRIFSVDQINKSLRATTREIAESFGHMLKLSGTDPKNGIALGGLVCSGVTAAMYTEVTAGTAILPSARALPLGNALVAYLADDEDSNPVELLHSDGDGSNPRIDAIVLTLTSVADTSENATIYPTGAVTPPVNIQRGGVVTFAIIEGTPAASPSYPAVPLTDFVVAYVIVPAGMTAGGGGMAHGTVIYEDARAVRNPSEVRNAGGLTVAKTVVNFDAYVAQQLVNALGTGGSKSLAWRMDDTESWWAMRRVGEPAGDSGADLFPMCVPGGREWEIFIPFGNGQLYDIVASVGIDVVNDGAEAQIIRSSNAAQSFGFAVTVPLPSRGLELVDATFHWRVVAAFDGTINTDDLVFGSVDHLAAVTDLSAGGTSMVLGATGIKSQNFTPTGTPVLVDDEFLRLAATINLANDGTAVGNLRLRGMSLRVREGRV